MHQRCPQEVKPVEVIISLKNMLADRGIYPDAVEKIIKTFEETGRTTPLSPAVDRQRARFGLPPLPPVPMDEIRKLIEPPDDRCSGRAPSRPSARAEARGSNEGETA